MNLPNRHKFMNVNITPAQHAALLQGEILAAHSCGCAFSERNVLVILSEAVLSGAQIDPDFQALANSIMAKAIILEKLPGKQNGRPKASFADGGLRYDSLVVAGEYFDLLDSGKKNEHCLAELATQYKKDERTISRIISEVRMWHGDTIEARNQARAEAVFKVADQPITSEEGRVELACMDKSAALIKLQTLIKRKSP